MKLGEPALHGCDLRAIRLSTDKPPRKRPFLVDRISGGADFGEEDERLMRAFAASAATAVATAQSVSTEQLRLSVAAAEAERALGA